MIRKIGSQFTAFDPADSIPDLDQKMSSIELLPLLNLKEELNQIAAGAGAIACGSTSTAAVQPA